MKNVQPTSGTWTRKANRIIADGKTILTFTSDNSTAQRNADIDHMIFSLGYSKAADKVVDKQKSKIEELEQEIKGIQSAYLELEKDNYALKSANETLESELGKTKEDYQLIERHSTTFFRQISDLQSQIREAKTAAYIFAGLAVGASLVIGALVCRYVFYLW